MVRYYLLNGEIKKLDSSVKRFRAKNPDIVLHESKKALESLIAENSRNLGISFNSEELHEAIYNKNRLDFKESEIFPSTYQIIESVEFPDSDFDFMSEEEEITQIRARTPLQRILNGQNVSDFTKDQLVSAQRELKQKRDYVGQDTIEYLSNTEIAVLKDIQEEIQSRVGGKPQRLNSRVRKYDPQTQLELISKFERG